MGRAGAGARRPGVPGGDPGRRRSSPERDAAARQDPARGARRRDGGAGRGSVRALLRQRRRHAAVRDAGGRLLAAHRRPRVHPDAGAARRARAGLDRARRRPRRRRVRRVRAADADGPGAAGVEGLARFDLPRRRHAGRGADRAVRGAGLRLRGLPGGGGDRHGAGPRQPRGDATCARRRCCGRASRRSSGTTSSARTCWRWTGTSAPAACAARTPGTRCGRESPSRRTRGRSPRR